MSHQRFNQLFFCEIDYAFLFCHTFFHGSAGPRLLHQITSLHSCTPSHSPHSDRYCRLFLVKGMRRAHVSWAQLSWVEESRVEAIRKFLYILLCIYVISIRLDWRRRLLQRRLWRLINKNIHSRCTIEKIRSPMARFRLITRKRRERERERKIYTIITSEYRSMKAIHHSPTNKDVGLRSIRLFFYRFPLFQEPVKRVYRKIK